MFGGGIIGTLSLSSFEGLICDPILLFWKRMRVSYCVVCFFRGFRFKVLGFRCCV